MSDIPTTPAADDAPAEAGARTMSKKDWKRLATGLAFISPNILGFLAFTVIPLVFSLVLAFSNWDLKQHNMFKDESIEFVGTENFQRLFGEHDFWKFLGNTLFLMLGMPIGIAGSLGAAMLLTKDLKVTGRGGIRKGNAFAMLIAGALMVVGAFLLAYIGMQGVALTVIMIGVAALMLGGGILSGQTLYRTLFFLPHFTASVALFILWKKMYNPSTGPINSFLAGPLSAFGTIVAALPAPLVRAGLWLAIAGMGWMVWWGANKLRGFWSDGELGIASVSLSSALVVAPIVFGIVWGIGSAALVPMVLLAAFAIVTFGLQARKMGDGPDLESRPWDGLGSGLMLALVLLIGQFILYGLGRVCDALPAMAAAEGGLQPPEWLADPKWAKPAIMLMGLWASIGGNTMLLYIAGLSNVPTELYEAASIDGASRFQRFWHVTWPQLAPVTFFVIVMGMIGGLQGGFEMARTMTKGGPYGATTTLSYFIYTEGFETVELGYASAVAWALFVLVFVVTMFNWRFGSQYVNE